MKSKYIKYTAAFYHRFMAISHFKRSVGLLMIMGFSLLPCRQTGAAELIAQSTTLNLEVVGTLPSSQPDLARDKVQQLLSLLEKDVSSKVPPDILIQVRSHHMKIVLTEDASTAEVFLDPDLSPTRELEIQLRPSFLLGDESTLLIVHAYFHAIHYVIHPLEEPWIREGLAQLFEYIVTNRLNSAHIDAAFSHPTTPLMGEYVVDQINDAQYGHDLLYFYYLYKNCGKDRLFWKIAKGSDAVRGSSVIENALKEIRSEDNIIAGLPQCSGFDASASSFEIARALNQESGATENSSRYFIRSGSHRHLLPIEKPTAEIFSQLKNIGRFEPLLFSFDTKFSLQDLNQKQRFWLHNEFPYEVREQEPGDISEDWTQLVFKP